MSDNSQGFPLLNSPVVDPKTGTLTQPWTRFFLSLWNRTGGGSGEIVVPDSDYSINDLLAADDPEQPNDLAAVMDVTTPEQDRLDAGVETPGEPDQTSAGLDPLVFVEEPVAEPRPLDLFDQDPGDVCTHWIDLFSMPADEAPRDDVTNLVSVTVGASPFTYQSPRRSIVLVVGGTMTATTFSRDGTTFYGIGTGTRFVILGPGDYLRLTYSAAPTVYTGSI